MIPDPTLLATVVLVLQWGWIYLLGHIWQCWDSVVIVTSRRCCWYLGSRGQRSWSVSHSERCSTKCQREALCCSLLPPWNDAIQAWSTFTLTAFFPCILRTLLREERRTQAPVSFSNLNFSLNGSRLLGTSISRVPVFVRRADSYQESGQDSSWEKSNFPKIWQVQTFFIECTPYWPLTSQHTLAPRMAGLYAVRSPLTGTHISHLLHGRPCTVLAVINEPCQWETWMLSWFWPLKMNESRRKLTDGLSSRAATPCRLGTLSSPMTHQMALGKSLEWTALTTSKRGLCLAQESEERLFSTCGSWTPL